MYSVDSSPDSDDEGIGKKAKKKKKLTKKKKKKVGVNVSRAPLRRTLFLGLMLTPFLLCLLAT